MKKYREEIDQQIRKPFTSKGMLTSKDNMHKILSLIKSDFECDHYGWFLADGGYCKSTLSFELDIPSLSSGLFLTCYL